MVVVEATTTVVAEKKRLVAIDTRMGVSAGNQNMTSMKTGPIYFLKKYSIILFFTLDHKLTDHPD